MVADFFLVKNYKQRHPFHIVEASSWPLTISLGALFLTVSFVSFFQGIFLDYFLLFFYFYCFLYFSFWCFDVLKESENSILNFMGYVGTGFILKNSILHNLKENKLMLKQVILFSPKYHSENVRHGLKFGFVLFIVSEIMFFFLFWAYFHSSLAPVVQIGSVWPSSGLTVIDPWGSLLNTLVLVTSGATLTFAHYSILECQSFLNVLDKFLLSKIFAINFNLNFIKI